MRIDEALHGVDPTRLTNNAHRRQWNRLAKPARQSAQLAGSEDLADQRRHFKSFSDTLIEMVRTFGVADDRGRGRGAVRLAHRLAAAQPGAGGCHSEPGRKPADRLHRMGRPLAAGCRGPGHLPADRLAAGRARRQGGAQPVDVRLLHDLSDLRRGYRILLVARAHPRKAQQPAGRPAARRRQPALGPDATALGQIFWYTLEGRDPDGGHRRLGPARTAQRSRTGMSATACWRPRASARWPPSAASCRSTRSMWIPTPCAPTA
jgi:hypothetical protein